MEQFEVGEKGLGIEELEAVTQLLHRNMAVFSQGETDLGQTPLTPP